MIPDRYLYKYRERKVYDLITIDKNEKVDIIGTFDDELRAQFSCIAFSVVQGDEYRQQGPFLYDKDSISEELKIMKQHYVETDAILEKIKKKKEKEIKMIKELKKELEDAYLADSYSTPLDMQVKNKARSYDRIIELLPRVIDALRSIEWIPISDIPEEWKDGRTVILCAGGFDYGVGAASYDYDWGEDGWWMCDDGKCAIELPLRGAAPTHAMLPQSLPNELVDKN